MHQHARCVGFFVSPARIITYPAISVLRAAVG